MHVLSTEYRTCVNLLALNVSAHVADNLFFISNPDNANSLENSVMSLFPRNLVNNTKKLWHSPQLTEF